VIVTGNISSDTITNIDVMIQGVMSIAAGGNINPVGVSIVESTGGSTPKYAEQNIINTMATIGTAQWMLATLSEHEGTKILEGTIVSALARLEDTGAARMGYSTTEVDDLSAQAVADV